MIVKPAAEQEEFQRNIQIIVGTVLGFGALAAVVVVACFCVYRRRTNNHSSEYFFPCAARNFVSVVTGVLPHKKDLSMFVKNSLCLG